MIRLAALLLLLNFACWSDLTLANERVLLFHSDIRVLADGHLDITETIRVQAEGREIKRGIYRDFPVRYRVAGLLRDDRSFEVLSVLRDGNPEAHFEKDQGTYRRLYIGQRDVHLEPGTYTYTIRYRSYPQLRHFDDHDELYWNVNGTGWGFNIDQLSATVHLPDGVPDQDVALEGYTGLSGERGNDFEARKHYGTFEFRTTRPLIAGENLSIVVSWPPGHVARPGAAERRQRLLKQNRDWLFALGGLGITLTYLLLAWLRVGRDPLAAPVVPLYRPDPGYSPAAMRYIRRMAYDNKCFATALVNMAVQGMIVLEESGPSAYRVIRNKESQAKPSAGERAILTHLAPGSEGIELTRSNRKRIKDALDAHQNSLKRDYDRSYFVSNRVWSIGGIFIWLLGLAATAWNNSAAVLPIVAFMTVWLSIWSIAVFGMWKGVIQSFRAMRGSIVNTISAIVGLLFALPFTAGEFFGLFMLYQGGGPAITLQVVLGAAMLYGFYQWMKAPTLAGRRMLDRVDGFLEYLQMAEADELRLKNPPQKTPELFERYLPYAMALDVEDVWGERFTQVFDLPEHRHHQTRWYHGSSHNLGSLGSAISSGLNSAIASSSSSGSGGGGSSGGGGGGGGGGGW